MQGKKKVVIGGILFALAVSTLFGSIWIAYYLINRTSQKHPSSSSNPQDPTKITENVKNDLNCAIEKTFDLNSQQIITKSSSRDVTDHIDAQKHNMSIKSQQDRIHCQDVNLGLSNQKNPVSRKEFERSGVLNKGNDTASNLLSTNANPQVLSDSEPLLSEITQKDTHDSDMPGAQNSQAAMITEPKGNFGYLKIMCYSFFKSSEYIFWGPPQDQLNQQNTRSEIIDIESGIALESQDYPNIPIQTANSRQPLCQMGDSTFNCLYSFKNLTHKFANICKREFSTFLKNKEECWNLSKEETIFQIYYSSYFNQVSSYMVFLKNTSTFSTENRDLLERACRLNTQAIDSLCQNSSSDKKSPEKYVQKDLVYILSSMTKNWIVPIADYPGKKFRQEKLLKKMSALQNSENLEDSNVDDDDIVSGMDGHLQIYKCKYSNIFYVKKRSNDVESLIHPYKYENDNQNSYTIEFVVIFDPNDPANKNFVSNTESSGLSAQNENSVDEKGLFHTLQKDIFALTVQKTFMIIKKVNFTSYVKSIFENGAEYFYHILLSRNSRTLSDMAEHTSQDTDSAESIYEDAESTTKDIFYENDYLDLVDVSVFDDSIFYDCLEESTSHYDYDDDSFATSPSSIYSDKSMDCEVDEPLNTQSISDTNSTKSDEKDIIVKKKLIPSTYLVYLGYQTPFVNLYSMICTISKLLGQKLILVTPNAIQNQETSETQDAFVDNGKLNDSFESSGLCNKLSPTRKSQLNSEYIESTQSQLDNENLCEFLKDNNINYEPSSSQDLPYIHENVVVLSSKNGQKPTDKYTSNHEKPLKVKAPYKCSERWNEGKLYLTCRAHSFSNSFKNYNYTNSTQTNYSFPQNLNFVEICSYMQLNKDSNANQRRIQMLFYKNDPKSLHIYTDVPKSIMNFFLEFLQMQTKQMNKYLFSESEADDILRYSLYEKKFDIFNDISVLKKQYKPVSLLIVSQNFVDDIYCTKCALKNWKTGLLMPNLGVLHANHYVVSAGMYECGVTKCVCFENLQEKNLTESTYDYSLDTGAQSLSKNLRLASHSSKKNYLQASKLMNENTSDERPTRPRFPSLTALNQRVMHAENEKTCNSNKSKIYLNLFKHPKCINMGINSSQGHPYIKGDSSYSTKNNVKYKFSDKKHIQTSENISIHENMPLTRSQSFNEIKLLKNDSGFHAKRKNKRSKSERDGCTPASNSKNTRAMDSSKQFDAEIRAQKPVEFPMFSPNSNTCSSFQHRASCLSHDSMTRPKKIHSENSKHLTVNFDAHHNENIIIKENPLQPVDVLDLRADRPCFETIMSSITKQNIENIHNFTAMIQNKRYIITAFITSDLAQKSKDKHYLQSEPRNVNIGQELTSYFQERLIDDNCARCSESYEDRVAENYISSGIVKSSSKDLYRAKTAPTCAENSNNCSQNNRTIITEFRDGSNPTISNHETSEQRDSIENFLYKIKQFMCNKGDIAEYDGYIIYENVEHLIRFLESFANKNTVFVFSEAQQNRSSTDYMDFRWHFYNNLSILDEIHTDRGDLSD